METSIQIREINTKDDPGLEQVKHLFEDMYGYMEETGLNLGLSEDGASIWLAAAVQGLGRFGTLCIASSNEDIVGFAHGSIRLTPDYLGTRKVGVITHIFVAEEYRGNGVGENLVESLEKWFENKDVHSVELQVLVNNKAGISFWEKLGYPQELLQHRKPGNQLRNTGE
jgi:ribosomal protein S18 acetylase RimI-like enzyme